MSDTQNAAQPNDIADLQFAIARAEEAAQNADDNEQIAKASKFRAKARELKAQLAELLGKQAKEPKTIRVAGCCRSCREGQYNQGHEPCSSAADKFIAQGWTIISEEYSDGGWEARLQEPQEKPAAESAAQAPTGVVSDPRIAIAKKIFIIEINHLDRKAALACFQSVFASTVGPTIDDMCTFDALEVAGAIESGGFAEVRCARESSMTRPPAGITLWIDLVSATKERRFRLHTEQSRATQPVEILFGQEGSLAAACDVLMELAAVGVGCSILRNSDEPSALPTWTKLTPQEAKALADEMGKPSVWEATPLDARQAILMGVVGAGKTRTGSYVIPQP